MSKPREWYLWQDIQNRSQQVNKEPHPNGSHIHVREILSDSATIENLCKDIGYGRVMQIAADLWKGIDPIGALTVGACVCFVKPQITP